MANLRNAAFWITRLDPTAAEVVLAISALAFGCALLIPVDLSTRSPAFRALVDLLPQGAWAGIWIAFGACQLAGAVAGYGRREADVMAASLWLFWTAVQVSHLGLTVGPFTYGWLAVSSIAASHLERRRGAA